jgi:hypothetical protein
MTNMFSSLTAHFTPVRGEIIEQKKAAIRKEISERLPLHIRLKLIIEVCGSDEITEIPAMLDLIADEVEKRGEIEYDLDPGETADWLRAEAEKARQQE